MTFLDALQAVYQGTAYGARPSSWMKNGDVYVFQDDHWRLEFNESYSLRDFRLPPPCLLFDSWDIASRDQVLAERQTCKPV